MYTAGKPQQKDGWISPDGEFYGCDWGFHDDCAEEIADCGTYTLEKRGWCHISSSFVVNFPFHPTQPQLNTLFDMFMLDPKSDFALGISIWINGGTE